MGYSIEENRQGYVGIERFVARMSFCLLVFTLAFCDFLLTLCCDQ